MSEEHAQPSEDLLEVSLRRENPNQTVKIGSHLNKVTKAQLTAFLQENTDLFVWSATDMPGIGPEMMSHHLKVDPTCCSIKQKRSFAPERQKAVSEEVDKLLKTGFIRKVMYPN